MFPVPLLNFKICLMLSLNSSADDIRVAGLNDVFRLDRVEVTIRILASNEFVQSGPEGEEIRLRSVWQFIISRQAMSSLFIS